MDYKNFKLCYIKGNQAFFTTKALDKQWGDDWDDAPYEHNAGEPYGPTVHYYSDGRRLLSKNDWNEDGSPRFQLMKVYFESSSQRVQIIAPCDNQANSPYSVEDINQGQAPWLSARTWDQESRSYKDLEALYAGASFPLFCEFIEKYGGNVFVPLSGLKAYPEKEIAPEFLESAGYKRKL